MIRNILLASIMVSMAAHAGVLYTFDYTPTYTGTFTPPLFLMPGFSFSMDFPGFVVNTDPSQSITLTDGAQSWTLVQNHFNTSNSGGGCFMFGTAPQGSDPTVANCSGSLGSTPGAAVMALFLTHMPNSYGTFTPDSGFTGSFIRTDAGRDVLNDGLGTFTITLAPDTPGVPEPGTMSLLGAGFIAMGWYFRRRRARP